MTAWQGSDRASRLPADWEQRRTTVKRRAGGRCEAVMKNGTRCRDRGAECDHVVPGDDHSLGNLRWICTWHHARKTAAEGNAARVRLTSSRPPEQHPGMA